MIPGLSAANSALYVDAINTHCEVRQTIHMLTLSHVLVSSIEPIELDGQINVVGGDTNGITKTLQAGFHDPDHALHLDSNVPSAGMGGMDRLLQVQMWVRKPEWANWLGATAFTGRPNAVARDGFSVTVEAQSKECLHMRKVPAYSFKKGANLVAVIEAILRRSGEHRFRFPKGTRYRIPKDVHVGGEDDARMPWKVAYRLAKSVGYQLFYDCTGWAVLRRLPTGTAWHLYEAGPKANVLSPVKVGTSFETLRNRVVVTGHTVPRRAARGRPARKSKTVQGIAQLPAGHPLSSTSLAVAGTPWSSVEYFDEPDVHTAAAARQFARARLAELSTLGLDVECKIVPVWHLNPMDIYAMHTRTGQLFRFRHKDGSAPLGPAGDGATVGYTERVRRASAGRLRSA